MDSQRDREIEQALAALAVNNAPEAMPADASARFDRSDYGLSYGVPRFAPEVKLQIQVEAIRAD
jgi:polyisoprenoid-binding protein YceI